MTQAEKNKEFQRITGEMLELYSSKNELYGDSFNQLMHELGLIAGLVPLDNKLRRVKSIVKGKEVKFESLEDSLMDLANYSILMLIHLKELEQLKFSTKIDGNVPATLGDKGSVQGTIFDPIEQQKDVYDYMTINVPDLTLTKQPDPCKTCTRINMPWNSTVHPCSGCPHYKEVGYEVYCSTTGGTDERK